MKRGRRGFVCILFDDQTPVQQPGPTPKCQHTPAPVGYNQWHGWAARMGKTHDQVRCPHCALFAIWVPKQPKPPRATKRAIGAALDALGR